MLAARARLGRTCCLSTLKESCQQTYTDVSAPSQRNSTLIRETRRRFPTVKCRQAYAIYSEEVSFDPRAQSAYNEGQRKLKMTFEPSFSGRASRSFQIFSARRLPRPDTSDMTSTGATMSTGTVRWFSYSKGCGFIIPDDGGGDVFAHFSGLSGVGLRSLHPNQRVSYDVNAGPKGRVASNIYSVS